MKYIIYIVAFLEWWTTLSVEIVALRKFTPIIGSNSISTSIILGVILLALSYGYYIGWKKTSKNNKIEQILVINLLIAALYYFFITFLFTEIILNNILTSTGSYFVSILLTSFFLFFVPVFLASQSIPLLSSLLKWSSSWEKMWKLLFFSTIGSFLGSISTSMFFFPLIWVFTTAILSSIILSFCWFIISLFFLIKNKKLQLIAWILTVFFSISAIILQWNSDQFIFQKANSYHTIKIYDISNKVDNKRIFSLNWWYSSWIDLGSRKSFFKYIQEVEAKILELKAENILVIGAAGFTFPNDISELDFVKNIDVIDIDPSLKHISETYFLQKKISNKVHFFAEPSRFYINKKIRDLSFNKYDLILVDAYSWESLPPQVLTKEFFENLEKIGENIFLNIITDSNLNSKFSQHLLSTLQASFTEVYFKRMQDWLSQTMNIIFTNKKYTNYQSNSIESTTVYTDDKNSIELDLFDLNNRRFINN